MARTTQVSTAGLVASCPFRIRFKEKRIGEKKMNTPRKQEGTGYELLGIIDGPRCFSPSLHFLFPELLFPSFSVIHLPVFKANIATYTYDHVGQLTGAT